MQHQYNSMTQRQKDLFDMFANASGQTTGPEGFWHDLVVALEATHNGGVADEFIEDVVAFTTAIQQHVNQ